MPATKYTYSIANDFPNAKVSGDRLTQEIRASAVITAFDYIGTSGDVADLWFKDALSSGDEASLVGLVAAHSGDPLPSEIPSLVTFGGKSTLGREIIEVDARSGSKTQILGPNFCDKRTWYAASTRMSAQAMTDTGDGNTFALAVDATGVDVMHGRIVHERRIRSTYQPVVRINGVVAVEKDPHDNAGDYTLDYDTMRVTFEDDQSGATVTMDYSKVGSSKWTLGPTPGKMLRLLGAELQFSTDASLRDTFLFQVRGDVAKYPALAPYWNANGGPFPAGTMLPLGAPVAYQTVLDLVCEANLSYPVVPKLASGGTWRDLQSDMMIFSWDYKEQATVDLSAGLGMDVEISLEHDVECGGTAAVITFYCLPEDEA